MQAETLVPVAATTPFGVVLSSWACGSLSHFLASRPRSITTSENHSSSTSAIFIDAKSSHRARAPEMSTVLSGSWLWQHPFAQCTLHKYRSLARIQSCLTVQNLVRWLVCWLPRCLEDKHAKTVSGYMQDQTITSQTAIVYWGCILG